MSKQENNPPHESEDNFGLPDIDFKPIARNGETLHQQEPGSEMPLGTDEDQSATVVDTVNGETATESESTAADKEIPYLPADEEEPETPSRVLIVTIILVLVLATIGLTYFFIYKPQANKALAEKQKKEKQLADKAKAKQDSLALVEEAQRKLDAEKIEATTKPAIGTIETLSEKTERYHVIVTSNIDDDLVMDFAKKLSKKGVSSKIIPPFGTSKYFRLSISNEDTFAKAQTNADAAKAEYGNGLWVIKY